MKLICPNGFLPERNYITSTVIENFLGLRIEMIIDNTATDYTFILPNENQLIISDNFFSKFDDKTGYFNIANIPQKIVFAENSFTGEVNIPVIFGSPEIKIEEKKSHKTIHCGIDIFASCFFMLARWEEFIIKERDSYRRFAASNSLAYKNNFLHRPVVNEYVEMLWNMLKYLGFNGKRTEHSFEIIPTHDIDIVHHRFSPNMLLYSLLHKKSLKAPLQRIAWYATGYNPYNTYEWLMNLSEKAGLISRFYFMGNGRHRYDRGYKITEQKVVKIIEKIKQRGHIIGFHPGYNSFNNAKEWAQQKAALENVAGIITEGRQHYLRFEVPETWQIWEQNNMKIDSTLGYASNTGFRCGTATEFEVFDIINRNKLKLIERPLILMEGTLQHEKYENKTPTEGAQIIDYYKNICKKYKMPFTILFHNSTFDTIDWKGWREVYENIF